MKRILLLAIGSLVGLLLVGTYVAFRVHHIGLPEGDTFAKQSFIFQCSVLFIGSIYNAGAIGYKLFGDKAESQKIRAYSNTHMLVLNILGVALFALSLVFK
jgi:hypothetical protein